jgi:hypothetical protein
VLEKPFGRWRLGFVWPRGSADNHRYRRKKPNCCCELPKQIAPRYYGRVKSGYSLGLVKINSQRNSAVGKIFQTLKDGNWHSAQELENKIDGKADLSGRIYRIEKRGAKRGLWKLEEKNGEYRLQFYAKANV